MFATAAPWSSMLAICDEERDVKQANFDNQLESISRIRTKSMRFWSAKFNCEKSQNFGSPLAGTRYICASPHMIPCRIYRDFDAMERLTLRLSALRVTFAYGSDPIRISKTTAKK